MGYLGLVGEYQQSCIEGIALQQQEQVSPTLATFARPAPKSPEAPDLLETMRVGYTENAHPLGVTWEQKKK